MKDRSAFLFKPALLAAAMREADRSTIETLGIPGFTLMETAGRAAVVSMVNRYGAMTGRHVACFCGKGNNGGDALVVARVLLGMGADVSLYLMAPREALSPDAAKNLDILSSIQAFDTSAQLQIEVLDTAIPKENGNFDLIVDGLLGTGVTRTLSDEYQRVVTWINVQDAPVIALDLPTGLHADTGAVLGVATRADMTVTMGALKVGLLIGQGPAYAGVIEVAEIGIPEAAIRKAARAYQCPAVVTAEAVRSWMPVRSHAAHKYSVGMSLVVAGSSGLTGAATLAATAAARSGAGAVICATPVDVQPLFAAKFTEIMTLGLPANSEGIAGEAAKTVLQDARNKASALLIGCGMGQLPATQAFIRELACESTLPLVIDADGLNAFVGHTHLLHEHAGGNWILTPHLGEFKRLAGKDVDLTDLIATVRRYAQDWRCVLVLKGAPTVVGDSEGNVFINPTVNPALATAGAGDVLAGLCAGFLSQGLSPVQAALTALFLGGEAADRYTADQHPATMFASDLIDRFTHVMNAYKITGSSTA